jgi:hypothetical protein
MWDLSKTPLRDEDPYRAATARRYAPRWREPSLPAGSTRLPHWAGRWRQASASIPSSPRLIRPIMSAQVIELRFRCRPCMPTCSHGASTFPLVNGDISSSGGGTSVEPAAICLTAAVRRTGTRHDRRGPTRRPDRRLARDRRHRRPRSGASTGHCGRTVSTGPRCSSPPSTWGCRPRRPPEATGYSPPCRRCSPAAQGSTWPGRAGRVPVAGQPTASSSRARISRVSGPRSGGRRRPGRRAAARRSGQVPR